MYDLWLSVGVGMIYAALVAVGALVSSVFSAVIVILVVWFIEKGSASAIVRNDAVRYACGLSVPFSILGVSIGVISGLARTTVVGNAIPAVLTLLAAASAYLYTKGRTESLIALVAMISISIALVVGTTMGASLRPG